MDLSIIVQEYISDLDTKQLLNNLYNSIKDFKWVISIKLILNASVPIIKLVLLLK